MDDFDDFWQAYPRKVGKAAARKAFAKALKVATVDEIAFGLSGQVSALSAKEKQFIPHASTWLNGERWNDEIEKPHSGRPPEDQRGSSLFDEACGRAIRSAERVRERGACEF